jgi:hypothetical protein
VRICADIRLVPASVMGEFTHLGGSARSSSGTVTTWCQFAKQEGHCGMSALLQGLGAAAAVAGGCPILGGCDNDLSLLPVCGVCVQVGCATF